MYVITSISHIQIDGLVERGPVPRPTRSPDLTSLDYFLWGSTKSMMYVIPVTSQEYLFARVHGVIESLT